MTARHQSQIVSVRSDDSSNSEDSEGWEPCAADDEEQNLEDKALRLEEGGNGLFQSASASTTSVQVYLEWVVELWKNMLFFLLSCALGQKFDWKSAPMKCLF